MARARALWSDPLAVEEWARRRAALRRNLLRPPPRLTISEWADRYRTIPAESSPEPGRWRTDRVPYLREVMDTLSARRVEKVVAMLSSQSGKTEIVLNTIGYFVDQEPSPILVVQPSERPMGEAFSRDRLAPMIRDTPRLAAKIKPSKSKDGGNTTLHKVFAGGHVTIAGANSAAGLSSRPVRVVLLDEIDRYPVSAAGEGDPVSLAVQRAQNFGHAKKVLMVSTPTVHGHSRIEREWARSDQRRYFVSCVECGGEQHLQWANLKWDRSAAGDVEVGPEDVARKNVVHHPNSAGYACEHCGVLIPEASKPYMLRNGEWRAMRAEGEFPGFALNALYSPWVSWGALARKWLHALDDVAELQAFTNLALAEPWEERDVELEPTLFPIEQYPAEVPNGVGVLTAACDVQADRLEVAIRGWGEGEESWLIAHHRLHGDPEGEEVWERLGHVLAKSYEHESGRSVRIAAAMVDSQYLKHVVFRFVRGKELRGVYAAQGTDGRVREPLTRATRMTRERIKPWTIDSHHFKTILFRRLRLTQSRAEPGGPGHVHFARVDAEYMAQLGAEVLTRTREGRRWRRVFKQVRERNEAIDLEYLAIAALHALGEPIVSNLGETARGLAEPPREDNEQKKAGQPTERRPPGTWAHAGRRRPGRWI